MKRVKVVIQRYVYTVDSNTKSGPDIGRNVQIKLQQIWSSDGI